MGFQIFLWIGVFLSAFFFLLLAVKKKKITSDRFLMAWLAVSGLHLVFYIHNLFYYSPSFKWVYLLGFSLSLIHAPLLFLYVCASTGEQRWFFRKFYLHFIPYLLFSAAIAILLSAQNIGVVKYGFLVWVSPPPLLFRYYGVVLAVSGLMYPAWSYLELRHYQRRVLPNNFSFETRVTLNWLKYWVGASVIYVIIIFILIVLAIDAGVFNPQELFKWVAAVIVLHLVYIGFFGLRQTAIFSNYPMIYSGTQGRAKPPPANQKTKVKKLNAIMDKDKPYLNPDLSLSLLAEQAGMSPHELSFLINNYFEVNFYQFINSYRVEEFKFQIQQKKNNHLKILAVAYDCGFNSKSTFNKVFKEQAGMSPSEFKKKMKV